MSRGIDRRKYTKDFKLEAVQLCRQPGMSVAKVASDLGVPANSLYRWKKELAESGGDAFREPETVSGRKRWETVSGRIS
jgi:transposase-like protein